jgi:hypothetical protein
MHKYPQWHANGLAPITLASLAILIVKSLGWVAGWLKF